MKKCPYCGYKPALLQFMTGYGSDTLLKHPVQAHAREHSCLKCHKTLWLHYDAVFFQNRFRQSLVLHLAFSAVITYFGVKPAMGFTETQAGLFMLMVMVLGGMLIMAYTRYESVQFEAEQSPRDKA